MADVDLMTVGDVAHLARVHPRTVTYWANAEKLPVFARTQGRVRLFRRVDVEAFLADRAVTQAESRREGGNQG